MSHATGYVGADSWPRAELHGQLAQTLAVANYPDSCFLVCREVGLPVRLKRSTLRHPAHAVRRYDGDVVFRHVVAGLRQENAGERVPRTNWSHVCTANTVAPMPATGLIRPRVDSPEASPAAAPGTSTDRTARRRQR